MNVKRWHSFDLPFLSTLAATRDTLTLEQLLTLADVGDRPKLARHFRSALDTLWSPFLARSSRAQGPGSPRTDRFYHDSLRDFFAGRVNRGALLHVENAFVDELAESTRQAHARIIDLYIRRWGGLDAGLPGVFHIAERDGVDHYGLAHLAEHLEGAGRTTDFHRLLRLEHRVGEENTGAGRAENVWFAARERVGETDGYLNDLARAARLLQVADRPEIESGQLRTSIGLGIRYALMSASINSLAKGIPPALISALVEKRVWLPEQGLVYARRVPDRKQQVFALIGVSTRFENPAKDSILREAIEMARWVGDKSFLSRALAALGRAEEALEVARGIGDVRDRTRTLAALGCVMKVLEVPPGIGDEWCRDQALAAMATHLVESGGGVVEGLGLAAMIRDEESRTQMQTVRCDLIEALGMNLLALMQDHLALPSRSWVSLETHWEETLCIHATGSRSNLLLVLDHLVPVITALGGSEAIDETCRAIDDVGCWWP